MIKLSVFTAVSLVAYVFAMVESAGVTASEFALGFVEVDDTGTETVRPFPGLDWVVWIAISGFGIRLYLHAWIVDESRHFRRALREKAIPVRICEWTIRLFWVAGMVAFPLILARSSEILERINPVSAFTWMWVMAISSLVWAGLLRSLVFSYSDESKDNLKTFWIWPDIVNSVSLLFVMLFMNWGRHKLDLNWMNWGVLIAVASFGVLFAMSMIQIFVWLPRIWREARRSTA